MLGAGIAAATVATGVSARAATKPGSRQFYVSPTGHGDGSITAPFGTLEDARDAIRALKTLPPGGITVNLRGGRYERTAPFALTVQDSGAADAPVVYRVFPGERAAVVGGAKLDGHAFAPVDDPAVLARLAPAARDQIRQISLPDHGITDYGTIPSRHYGTVEPATPQLVVDDTLCRLARWPDTAYAAMGTIINQGQSGADLQFQYTDDRPDHWATTEDTWVLEYAQYNWAFQTLPISAIDTATKTITCGGQTLYGAVAGARYFYFNVLEELDTPGEWYLDRSTGMLYVYPPTDLAGASIRLTQLDQPLVTMDSVSHLSFDGISFGETRVDAMSCTNCTDITVSAATFAFIGNHAVTTNGGARNVIQRCTMYDIGTGAVVVNAGDRPTLTPGDCAVQDSHFFRYSIVNPTYSPAISCGGVGNRIAHNEINDAPHEAVAFSGNDHVVEYNEIHHVVSDSADAGAIYGGRDWTWRGNVFRYNYLHDITNDVPGGRKSAVYLDDMVSGCYVYGNIFENVDTGIQHCGRHNVADNNIMIDCNEPVYIGNWGAKDLDTLTQRLNAMPYQSEPWASRYPELLTILNDDPGVPKYNTVIRTVESASGASSYVADAVTYGTLMDNWVTDNADLGFAGNTHYLRGDSPVFDTVADFGAIPAGLVGRYSDGVYARRGSDLVTAYTESGDITKGLARQLIGRFAEVSRALRRHDQQAAAAGLRTLAGEIGSGASRHACSIVAAAGLTGLVDAVLAAVTADVFAGVTPHLEKSVITVGESVDAWTTGEMLSGSCVNVLPTFALTSRTPVATVVDRDAVRGARIGTAMIRATATSDGVTQSGDVAIPVVAYLLKSLQITADSRLVAPGAALALTVTGTTTAGDPVTFQPGDVQFASSDSSVATVDATGSAVGVAVGTALISARASANGVSVESSIGLLVGNSTTLPDGWTLRNLGATVHGGSIATQGLASYQDNTFRVLTDGANIWNDSDDATFLYRSTNGSNVSVSATITAGTNTSGAGYGVMIRDGNSPSAHEVNLRYQDGGQLNLVYRNDQSPTSAFISIGAATLPVQLRLTKSGDEFTAYRYQNGDWQSVGSTTVTMGEGLQVGIGAYASTALVAEVTCTDIAIT